LLEDLSAVSRGTTTLKQESRTKLASLTKPVHVQVFVTPTCPYCPKVASLAHQAAVESGNVTADVIEISEFPDLAPQYHVQGVPKVVMTTPWNSSALSRRLRSWMRCSERQLRAASAPSAEHRA
jgi:thiol-disulfide isomerase/thioredoxin